MGKAGTKCESSWKNANGYVWGKIIHKPDIHWAENFEAHLRIEKSALKCLLLMVAETKVGWAAKEGIDLEDGWSLQEAYL